MTPDRLYAALLLVYPPAFRREYGESMLDAFGQLRRARRGSEAAFWRFILADVCRSALRAQLDACRYGTRRLALEWTATCAGGAVMTALLANALTSLFSYLYHPYLEGVALPAWSYGALLGAGLGLAQNAIVQRRRRLGIRWILGSAAATAIGLEAAVSSAKLAGPAGYGLVLGSVVGLTQWAVLRAHVRRAASWALASSVALSIAMFGCAVTLHTTFQGLNAFSQSPLRAQPEAYDATVRFLTRGLYAPATHADFTLELAVMVTCGLVIAVLTVKPLAVLHDRQEKP
jgi:hypothetical protein